MIDNFEKKNIIVRLSFVTPIITNYLSLKNITVYCDKLKDTSFSKTLLICNALTFAIANR